MKYFKFVMIFLICLIATTTSCNDMDKIHQQYLDGEIIYSGKLDTLLIRPGMYRAQLEAYTHLLGNSNKVIVEFDNRTEIYDIESDVPEIYSVIIENLDEDFFEFDVITQDQEGNLMQNQTTFQANLITNLSVFSGTLSPKNSKPSRLGGSSA